MDTQTGSGSGPKATETPKNKGLEKDESESIYDTENDSEMDISSQISDITIPGNYKGNNYYNISY